MAEVDCRKSLFQRLQPLVFALMIPVGLHGSEATSLERVVAAGSHDVRHPDERQLQRVGLQPDIEAVPTIGGIASGRDEVLECAIDYLKTREN